jgi:hypothetical protein
VKISFDCVVLVVLVAAPNDGFENALEGLNEDTDCVRSSPEARVVRYLFIVACFVALAYTIIYDIVDVDRKLCT